MILQHKGINIFYTDQGQGSALVLLHGFLENSNMWNAFTPELSKKNRVVCIDLLGHGKTDCLGYVHSMELMAEMVETVLKHLKLRRYYMIGHSMGGYVALAFAEQNPENIKGLCLMNSTYEADDEARKQLRRRAIKMVQTNFENMIRMSFTNLFSPESKTKHKLEIEYALQEALKTSIQGYIACNEGMIIRKNRKHIFLNGNFKRMLVLGKKDPVINSAFLLNDIKNSDVKITEFPDGHMSHIENKAFFLQKIMHFIE